MSAAGDAWLYRMAQVVGERLGLEYPSERWPDLERGIRLAAREIGSDDDIESFARDLLDPAAGEAALDVLAHALTIGETYFFRERRSFEVLEQEILPALIAERQSAGRRLRLWSAGCCTGEEAYSLAIIVARLLPRRQDWQVSILATDVNPRFLESAARGEFGPWSFRDAPPGLLQRHFREVAPQRFAIDPRIRSMVRFARLNLAEPSYPDWRNDTQAMDVILCRNVLMYFSSDGMRQSLLRFARALTDGGWLAVSAAEAPASAQHGLAPVHFDGAVFYRKGDQGVALPTNRPAPAATVALAAPPQQLAATLATARPPHVPPVPAAAPPRADALDAARRHADAGQLDRALEAVERAVAANRLDAAAHHLHAAILAELGREGEAAEALRRALYVEHDFVLAHHALGQLALRHGQHAQAARHFGNALALLDELPEGSQLPRSGGLAAGQLRAAILDSLSKRRAP